MLVSNKEMIDGLTGRLVDITIDGQTVKARIIECNIKYTSLKVVPNGTKD